MTLIDFFLRSNRPLFKPLSDQPLLYFFVVVQNEMHSNSLPPTSPQHSKSLIAMNHNSAASYNNSFYMGGGGDEFSSPTCVFAASFDSMAAYEEQQQQLKDNNQLEHRLSQISLTRSGSHASLSYMAAEDTYDQELMMSYTMPNPETQCQVPTPPPQVRRTTSMVGRSDADAVTSSSSRPSDPVARLLLSK